MPKSEERNLCFFIARGQSAEAFHAVEEAFNFRAVFVLRFVKRGWFCAIRAVGKDYVDALFGAVSPVFIAIIGRVRTDLARVDTDQQRDGQWAVICLATRYEQANSIAQRVHAGVNFRAQPATASAQAFRHRITFFWPAAYW